MTTEVEEEILTPEEKAETIAQIKDLSRQREILSLDIQELAKALPQVEIDPNQCVECGNCLYFLQPSKKWKEQGTGVCNFYLEEMDVDPEGLLCGTFKERTERTIELEKAVVEVVSMMTEE